MIIPMALAPSDECELEGGSEHPTGLGDPSIPDGDERVVYGILKGPESWNPFTIQVRSLCMRSEVLCERGREGKAHEHHICP